MRIAVIADTHMPRGARRLAPECVRRLREADLILHAGDVVGAEFLEELRALGPPLEAVYGNMDEPALQAALPREHVVEAAGARIGLVHIAGPTTGRAERLRARFPDCDAVVYGHTHVPELRLAAGTWILNPGSPTERRTAPGHSLLSLDVLGPGRLRPELVAISP
jgi:putative phosphoesterase